MDEHAPRYRPDVLVAFAADLFRSAGLDEDKAQVVASYLVEADLLGHSTHGLQLAAPYLRELDSGAMRAHGEPEIVGGRGAVALWDGLRLPGVWLTARAVAQAVDAARSHGIGAVAVRNSHHIGCLAAFLERAARDGFLVLLTCSDPATASVAPFGGLDPVMTPDPLAVGIPTGGDPVLIDISASITTNGLSGRLHAEGRRLPGVWAQDHAGVPGNDPGVLFTDPPGTLLPVGGLDHGHKGYGLGLTVEALSQGLGGHGRADAPQGWGASVYVQATDPEAFGGRAALERQTAWLVARCRASRPAPGVGAVRLPGERGLALKREALARGVSLYPGILEPLLERAAPLGIAPPQPLP
jgi:LDH2 family malate/lactate/ureidoglycolate dehydrogenase